MKIKKLTHMNYILCVNVKLHMRPAVIMTSVSVTCMLSLSMSFETDPFK